MERFCSRRNRLFPIWRKHCSVARVQVGRLCPVIAGRWEAETRGTRGLSDFLPRHSTYFAVDSCGAGEQCEPFAGTICQAPRCSARWRIAIRADGRGAGIFCSRQGGSSHRKPSVLALVLPGRTLAPTEHAPRFRFANFAFYANAAAWRAWLVSCLRHSRPWLEHRRFGWFHIGIGTGRACDVEAR